MQNNADDSNNLSVPPPLTNTHKPGDATAKAEEVYSARLASWEKARFAPPPEGSLNPTPPTWIEKVPMRDGVRLYTEIFLPPQAQITNGDITESFPVILSRSPYPAGRPSRNDLRQIPRYLTAGYVVVFQLVRGQGPSEGHFRKYHNESDDGYDAVQWIAEQSWCNGNVGMYGVSYLGSAQLLAARAKPPALKCIMPTGFVGHFTRCHPFFLWCSGQRPLYVVVSYGRCGKLGQIRY